MIWPFSLFIKPTEPAAPSTPAPSTVPTGPTLGAAPKEVETRYKREVWWLEHRRGLRKGGIVALVIIEAAMALIGLWAFADYFLIDYVDEQNLIGSFFEGAEDLKLVTEAQAPLPLAVSEPRTVTTGSGFDVVALVDNRNEGHVAQISYRWVFGEESTEQERLVILQDTTVPLAAFGVGKRPSNPELVIDKTEWWRVDRHTIGDPVAWKNARLNLVTVDARHDNDVVVGDETFGRTTLTLNNQSGYGYYAVDLFVILKRGGATVGVNETTVSNLEPREERRVQLDWFDATPSPDTIEVYPVVNLFDDTVYLPPQGEDAPDPRDAVRRPIF